eukprot:763103-Hanusia_phi.AAC.3
MSPEKALKDDVMRALLEVDGCALADRAMHAVVVEEEGAVEDDARAVGGGGADLVASATDHEQGAVEDPEHVGAGGVGDELLKLAGAVHVDLLDVRRLANQTDHRGVGGLLGRDVRGREQGLPDSRRETWRSERVFAPQKHHVVEGVFTSEDAMSECCSGREKEREREEGGGSEREGKDREGKDREGQGREEDQNLSGRGEERTIERFGTRRGDEPPEGVQDQGSRAQEASHLDGHQTARDLVGPTHVPLLVPAVVVHHHVALHQELGTERRKSGEDEESGSGDPSEEHVSVEDDHEVGGGQILVVLQLKSDHTHAQRTYHLAQTACSLEVDVRDRYTPQVVQRQQRRHVQQIVISFVHPKGPAGAGPLYSASDLGEGMSASGQLEVS